MKIKQYDAINIMKVICSIFVIGFHCNPFNRISVRVEFILNNFIFNIAVPFFFVCSGYFFWEKYKTDKIYIKSYLKRLLKIYLIWSMIYLPWIIFKYCINDRLLIYDFIILVRNIVFSGTVYHLWYLVTLIYSIIIIGVVLEKERYLELIIISIISLVIIILGNTIPNIEDNIIIKIYSNLFGGIKTGILYGIPCVSIGILTNKYDVKKYKVIFKFSSLIYLVLLLINIYNNYYNGNIVFILTLIIVVGLLRILLSCKYTIKNKRFKYIREISLNVYCIHVLILIMISKIEDNMHIQNKYINIYNFIMVTIISFGVSMILIYLKKRFIKSNKILYKV